MATTREWNVRIFIFEEEGTTTARAVLDTGESTITGRGVARCNPEDIDIPEIGDELAASRAMAELGRQLMRVADRDLQGVGAGPLPARTQASFGWPDPNL
ncbi:protein of unknown function [Streptomyces sp. WMMB 714]|jgi:hypothetical protein|uniref:DUF1876 domain-containing protein n=1 Tax=Streptomyces sp. WMMB 714 TaxID=1286822 RepID=UPI0005F874A3|nr:DUF1876 domain-containing protein [Streptomyces sp. WMMB 714]SCK39598.1 protein of unknown function [Streptomyces sp. WMMB 714]